jgi:glycosyltransferase involved in cell wall biosynthesis
MTNALPFVSVFIPTYRGEATIGSAIESVLAQTFSDFELVVIDDGSPDSTRAIVAQYHDPRLRYVRNEHNLGPEGNWNRCLAEARGKYFKLLPHDDLLYPECLARQVAALEADCDERIALTFSARDVIGPRGNVLTRRGYPGATEGRIDSNAVLRACVRRGTNLIGEPGAVLLRKSLADRIGAFDGTNPYVIDLDYWFRLLAHGDAWYSSEPLAAFRVSAQQWSVVIGRSQSRDFVDFVRRIATAMKLELNTIDFFSAHVMSILNNAMRLAFYKFYLR